ncbi:MAG: hypothetical protein U0176_20215 [Bacteroidia bacterium]
MGNAEKRNAVGQIEAAALVEEAAALVEEAAASCRTPNEHLPYMFTF